MSKRTIDIRIGAKDETRSAIRSALSGVKDLTSATSAEIGKQVNRFRQWAKASRDVLIGADREFERIRKSASATYETLDQLNARIDAPRKAAQAQEEHNRALKRYCELLEQAKKRETERVFKAMHPSYNAISGMGKRENSQPQDAANGGGMHLAWGGAASVKRSAQSSIAMMMALDRLVGETDGKLGKVAAALKGIVGAATMFGPAGLAVSTAFTVMSAALEKFREVQERAANKILELAEKNLARMSAWRESRIERIEKDQELIERKSRRESHAFERGADAREINAQRNVLIAAAQGEARLEAMRGEMSRELFDASEDKRGEISSRWRIKIAEEELAIAKEKAQLDAESERVAIDNAQKRLDLARKQKDERLEAANRAEREYNAFLEGKQATVGKTAAERDPEVKRLRGLADKARDAAEDSERKVDNLAKGLDMMQGQASAEAIRRKTGIAAAENSVNEANAAAAEEARKAAEERQKAEIAAAQAAAKERERLDRELHQRRMADLRAEIEEQKKAASPLQAVAAHAQTEFERAFAMYRDPSRAASEIAEERDRSADLKRLHKDANRYGGKWRIDELSQLMAAGDSQGVQSRLEDWRKSKSFTPEVEAMVRASAAEQTKTTAEDELRKLNDRTEQLAQKMEQLSRSRDGKLDGIERNTASLAGKVQELLAMRN